MYLYSYLFIINGGLKQSDVIHNLMMICKGDSWEGQDEHQQADHDRLCSEHIHRHDPHFQPDAPHQTQVDLFTLFP